MNETIRDVMTPHVETIFPSATVQEAAEKMKSLDIGVLPVCDDGKVIGVVTDRDIIVKTVAINHDPRATSVDEIMSVAVYSCYEDESVKYGIKIMEQNQVRRLAVYNRLNKLVGIASMDDLVKTDRKEELVEARMLPILAPVY